MACRQGALGSPVQLRRSADGDRGLPGGRRGGPPPRDDGSGDRRLPPGRVDEPRGTRAVVPTPGRSASRVARRLREGVKSADFLPRVTGPGDDRDHGLSEGRDARRDDRRRAGFSRGPESLVQAAGRLRSVWNQEVFGGRTTVVQQAGVAGPAGDRGDEFPAPPDRAVHVRGVVSRGGPGGRPGRLAAPGRRGGTWWSGRLRAGRRCSSGRAESSSTAKRCSSKKPPVATARPLRSPGGSLNSERPSRPASLESSSRKAD